MTTEPDTVPDLVESGRWPDPDLVEQLRAGSSVALEVLFERYVERIHAYCFRRTASWALAEDATSTVFLEVWRHRDRALVHEGSVLPWLFGFATNVCRNATRSQRRLAAATARLAPPADEPDHADLVAARLDDVRRMAPLLRALRTLPRRDQDVLTLVDWSGLSYAEAAAALDVPVGTVRSRLARARARLTDTLATALEDR
jgi:RNA polymerase sigma-70 factor (ECF subfamily)